MLEINRVGKGNENCYSEAIVIVFVYKRSGDYEPSPEYIKEFHFASQFTETELIVWATTDATLEWGVAGVEGYKPDIRRIDIEYVLN